MDPHIYEWRFFTKPIEEDGAAGHRWCWARLDANGRVVAVGKGFYTIVAAVHDAKGHGFTGDVEVGDPQVLVDHFGDRRKLDIVQA
ncbi:MAG TPA: hypothetical protein VHP37_26235 [Burkholderiales bacterium]|nr:hypothetical protein [Burkholderiales bacterium]